MSHTKRPGRPRRPLRPLLAVLALGLAARTYAAAPAVPPLPPAVASRLGDFRSLLAPAGDLAGLPEGTLGPGELERAALLASGPPPERLEAYARRLDALLAGLAGEVAAARPAGDVAGRAEEALAAIHRRALRAYSLDATTLQEILDTGTYNCVSSAVLYGLVLKRLGIDFAGVKTADHAFCLVRLPGREVDVETTSPAGFDPGTKKEFTDGFGRTTGFSYVPPGDYRRRSTIGERSLVALILSNRASLLERAGRYDLSLALGASYLALDPSPEGRGFLLDRVNNLAAELLGKRDQAGAWALAEAAIAALPGAGPRGEPEPRLLELAGTAAYARALASFEARRWDAALDGVAEALAAGRAIPGLRELAEAALSRLARERIAAKDWAGGRAAVAAREPLLPEGAGRTILRGIAESELAEAVRSLPFAAALQAADRARAEGSIDARRWEEFAVFVYGNEANRVARGEGRGADWLGAARVAEEGARRAPGDGSLARAAAGFRRNFVAEAHNAFAELYNARDYAGALAAVEKALRALPGDPTLEADRAAARAALGKP